MRLLILLSVYILWIKHALGDELQTVWRNLAKETRRITLVACSAADLLDFQQHRVAVAIDKNLAHVLNVAALFALAPESPASATEVHRFAARHCLIPSLAVHVGDHQHLACR